MVLRWLLVIVPGAVLACSAPVTLGGGSGGGPDGGSSSGGSSGSGSGGSSGSSSSGGSSGSGSGGGSNDLTGTWDLLATSQGGGTTSGTLVLGASTFNLDIPSTGSSLAYSASGSVLTVLWTLDGSATSIATTRAAAAMNLGIIPEDVGGTWSFSSSAGGSDSCTVSLAASQVSGACNGYVPNWPYPLPAPLPGVHYTATRTGQLNSVFGDLGGTWQVSDGQGGPGACTVTFQGSTFSSSCNGATDALGGTVQLTFSGTTMASGTTGNGIELSAQKQ